MENMFGWINDMIQVKEVIGIDKFESKLNEILKTIENIEDIKYTTLIRDGEIYSSALIIYNKN